MSQDHAMRAFHHPSRVFVVVVGLLAALNLYRDPQQDLVHLGARRLGHRRCRARPRAPLAALRAARGDLHRPAEAEVLHPSFRLCRRERAARSSSILLYTPEHYWFLFPLLGWGVLLPPMPFSVLSWRGAARTERQHEEAETLVRHRRWRSRAVRRARRGRRLPHGVELRLHRAAQERARAWARSSGAGQGERDRRPAHAIEPRRDLHEAAKEDFIRTVAADLAGDLHRQGKFDELVLVAPPGVLDRAEGRVEQADGRRSSSRSCKRT